MRKNLIELRERRELSQEQLCKIAGIDRSGYSKIETGKRDPSLPTAIAIGLALGISVDPYGLFKNEEEENNGNTTEGNSANQNGQ